MISTLHVYNFKGLKDLPLSRLKRFNLFVGMNNSGKSSLLEALYLVASGVSPYAIEAVLKFRGYTLLQRRDTDSLLEDNLEKFSSLYYGRTIHDFYKSPIIFKWDENELQCKVANYRFNLSPSEDGINTIPFVKEYDPTDADVAIGEHPVLIVKHNGKRTGIIDINRGRPFRRQDALYQCQLVRTSQTYLIGSP